MSARTSAATTSGPLGIVPNSPGRTRIPIKAVPTVSSEVASLLDGCLSRLSCRTSGRPGPKPRITCGSECARRQGQRHIGDRGAASVTAGSGRRPERPPSSHLTVISRPPTTNPDFRYLGPTSCGGRVVSEPRLVRRLLATAGYSHEFLDCVRPLDPRAPRWSSTTARPAARPTSRSAGPACVHEAAGHAGCCQLGCQSRMAVMISSAASSWM